MNICLRLYEKVQNKISIKEIINGIIAAIFIIIILVLIRYSRIVDYLNLENINKLKAEIEIHGIVGHLIYIAMNVFTGFIGLPVIIIKFMGGVIYGPVLGTILTSIGSTLGALISFITSRYAIKGLVKKMVNKNKSLKRIYEGVDKNGLKMIIITRLVPIFPYSLQNYVYGITEIKMSKYILTTFIFMLPSNFGMSYLASSATNKGSILSAIILYLLVVLIFGISGFLFIEYLNKRKQRIL